MSGNLKNSLNNETKVKYSKLKDKLKSFIMDEEKSFKLIDPKTGKERKIIMDPEKSFKLVNLDGEEVKLKGKLFKINLEKIKVKKKTKITKAEEEKILVLLDEKDLKDKKYEKSKFEKFFTEPTFNLLEILIALVLIGVIAIFVTLGAKDKDNNNNTLNDPNKEYETINDSRLTEFIDLYTDVINNYYQNVDSDELLDTVTKAMIEYLGDAYTGYIDEYEARNLKDRLEGKYNGLGFEIATRTDDDAVIVTNIFKGTTAEKSGIKPGDVIKSVNEIDVTGKNSGEVSILIKDKLTGVIRVVVEREGKLMTFDIEKGEVIIQAVSTEMFGNTGYIKIDSFSKAAVLQVQNALSKLEKEGMTSLVVDVRNNEGGYLDSAFHISDLFIKKNKVIYKLKTSKETKTFKGTASSSKNYKVAVLINGGSASAAEVFALAMRDSYGATLVGSKSYGKGTVQETTELSTGSLVKYTVAKWLGPNGESINGVGIVPDVHANLGAAYMKEQTHENDGQLQRAIKAVTE